MNENENLVPKRRFKEFTNTGTWEQRKLGDMVEFFSGLTYSPDNVIKQPGTLVLRSSNVQNGEIVNADNVYVDNEVVNSDNVQVGDIAVVVRNGSRSLIGKHAAIKYPMKDTVIGAFMTGVRSDTPSFTNALLDTQQFETEIAKNLGATINQITTGNFKKMIFNFPEIDERLRIGDFFNQLDNTIALHQDKQQKLGLLKKRLVKELFPQDEWNLPHIRFANFNNAWEQHQLKEVLRVNSGRDYKHLNEGDIPVYGTGGYMLSVDGKLSDVDSIGLGRKGTIDKPQYLRAPFWTVDTLFYLTPFPNYDIYFLFTLTQSINWKTMDESTGVPSLSKAVIEKVTRTFPSFEEQKKIGLFFKQLDETISHHQQKIDNMKSLKRALLNKMFI